MPLRINPTTHRQNKGSDAEQKLQPQPHKVPSPAERDKIGLQEYKHDMRRGKQADEPQGKRKSFRPG